MATFTLANLSDLPNPSNTSVTVSSNAFQVQPGTGYVMVNNAVASPTITLPTGFSGPNGLWVVDRGNAGSFPITIIPASGNINGNPSYVIAEPFGAVFLAFDGTNWAVLVG